MVDRVTEWWIEHRKNIALLLWGYFILQILLYIPFFVDFGYVAKSDFPGFSPIAYMGFFDGPFYIAIAHTFYNAGSSYFEVPWFLGGVEYYTNHFPLFPLIIRFFSFFMPITMAGLIANQAMSIIGLVLVYYLFCQFMGSKEALVVSFFQVLLPVRSLLWHHVANSEPTYLVFLLASILFAIRGKWWWGLLLAMAGQLVRPMSIVLFPTFILLALLEPKHKALKLIGSVGIPLVFVAVQLYFFLTIPNFSFTHRPGGFMGLIGEFPFGVFIDRNFNADGIVYLLLMAVLGAVVLVQKRRQDCRYLQLLAFCVPMIYLAFYIKHPDSSRYIWPFLPVAIFIPLKDIFQLRSVQIALLVMLPAILFASWGVLLENQMPLDSFRLWLFALGTT